VQGLVVEQGIWYWEMGSQIIGNLEREKNV